MASSKPRDFEVTNFPPKAPIKCEFTAKDEKQMQGKPELIFTHGSGGNLTAAAVVNFVSGFASVFPILCFQGNMNLSSRTKMFQSVCADQNNAKHLGGRSMGARAAVMAATDDTTRLALVSYPLHSNKDTRDQILLDLPATMKVIFISGDQDAMCEPQRLEEVRKKMKCETWMVLVKGADHGMNVKPKSENGTTSMGTATGYIVARWLGGYDKGAREATLSWQPEEKHIQWCGWDMGSETGRRTRLGPLEFEVLDSPGATIVDESHAENDQKHSPDLTKIDKKRSKHSKESVPRKPVKRARR